MTSKTVTREWQVSETMTSKRDWQETVTRETVISKRDNDKQERQWQARETVTIGLQVMHTSFETSEIHIFLLSQNQTQ